MSKFGEAMPMKEAKERLKNLKIEGDADNLLNEFGMFLSDRLNDTLVPDGFVLSCEMALYDLSIGVNGYTGKPIMNRLACYPPTIYAAIRMRIPEIAKEIFPEEFSNDVEKFMKEVNEKMRKEV